MNVIILFLAGSINDPIMVIEASSTFNSCLYFLPDQVGISKHPLHSLWHLKFHLNTFIKTLMHLLLSLYFQSPDEE